jgi:hypothetical protein
MSDEEKFRLGFIDIYVFEDVSIRGGLLITGMGTRPFEFRTTSAIKPSSFRHNGIYHYSTLHNCTGLSEE